MTTIPQSPATGELTAVPFTDLAAMAGEVWPEIEQDYLACLLDGAFIGGPAVAAFEREWAAYCGARHAVGLANGTDALELSLTALGIGAGDEVVVPANTFAGRPFCLQLPQMLFEKGGGAIPGKLRGFPVMHRHALFVDEGVVGVIAE